MTKKTDFLKTYDTKKNSMECAMNGKGEGGHHANNPIKPLPDYVEEAIERGQVDPESGLTLENANE